MTKLTNCLITEEASESYSSRSSEPNFPALNNEPKVSANGLLRDAISRHSSLERASFHTPGHKGRSRLTRVGQASLVQIDPGQIDLEKIDLEKTDVDQIDFGQTSLVQNVLNKTDSSQAVLSQTGFRKIDDRHLGALRSERAQCTYNLLTDVTELPGLDDLSHPTGVLANLNHKASCLWNTRSSLISVNGASAGIFAAILSVSPRGNKIVVPRNAHKSVITGLVLSGLEPIWYTPEWNPIWGVFDHVEPSTLASTLEQYGVKDATRAKSSKDAEGESGRATGIAAVVIVSPTYAGAFSDMNAISAICKRAGIALIVDEAHGAHVFHGADSRSSATSHSGASTEQRLPSAIEAGADIVIHSLHKTLGGMTQTGLVHLPHDSKITEANLSHHLNMLQSTSPSYTLMLSIEDALAELCGSGFGDSTSDANDALEQTGDVLKQSGSVLERGEDAQLERINCLARNLRLQLTGSEFQIYDTACGTDTWHILLRHETKSSTELFDYLLSQGIYPECELGSGVLLLLGVGTSEADITLLVQALNDFVKLNLLDVHSYNATNQAISEVSASSSSSTFASASTSSPTFATASTSTSTAISTSISTFRAASTATSAEIDLAQPPSIDQVLTPRTASMALSKQVAIADAENFIAAECIAPCPPGIPTCVPGQRLTKEVLNKIAKDHVRVVQGPPTQYDIDPKSIVCPNQ